MKKTVIILIVVFLVLLIGACATFGALYFFSDTFITSKEGFYKYALKVDLDNFVNKDFYKEYANKLKNSSYEENIDISLKMQDESKNINIDKKVDVINEISSADITVDGDNTEKVNLKYLKNGDTLGILWQDVIKQYIGIENNNLKNFAETLGLDEETISMIPNKIEFENIMETNETVLEEEIKEIYERYKKLIFETIPEECYTKVEKQQTTVGNEQIQADGYKLSLRVEDMKTILKTVIENVKNDTQIFNIVAKLNTEITLEEYQEQVDHVIDSLDEEILEEDNVEMLTITVYKKNKETKKIYIKAGNTSLDSAKYIEMSIDNITTNPIIIINVVEKNSYLGQIISIIINKNVNTQTEENWNITITNQYEGDEVSSPLTININRTGDIKTSQIINTMNLNFEDDSDGIAIEYKNNTQFRDSVEIEKFTNDNILLLNTMSQEEINKLFEIVSTIASENVTDKTVYLYSILGLTNAIYNGNAYEQVAINVVLGAGINITTSLQGGLIEKAKSASEKYDNYVYDEQNFYDNYPYNNEIDYDDYNYSYDLEEAEEQISEQANSI